MSPAGRGTAMRPADRIDAETYHRDIVPGLLAGERGHMAATGLDALRPLTLAVGDAAWTYRRQDGRLRVEPAAPAEERDACVCVLSPEAWTDFVTQLRTAAALA